MNNSLNINGLLLKSHVWHHILLMNMKILLRVYPSPYIVNEHENIIESLKDKGKS